MANDYLNLLDERASEKFYLVTLNGARNVTSLLSLVSGTTYEYFGPFVDVVGLKVDGVAYTKVGTSSAASTEFYYGANDDNRLVINFGAALTTQTVIAEFQFYLTTDIYRTAQQDPRTPSGSNFTYEPRVSNNPSFTFSQRDIYSGTLSSSSTSISLINTDNYFQTYLTSLDSFYNREVVFYHCINSIENVNIIFKGEIIDLDFNNTNINFSIIDTLVGLDQTLYSGTSYTKSIVNKTDYPAVLPAKVNATIPIIEQQRSKYKITTNNESGNVTRIPSFGVEACGNHNMIIEDTFEGINIDASSFQFTTNRKWILYKAATIANPGSNITAITGPVAGRYTVTFGASDLFIPGDNVRIFGANVIDSHGVVLFKISATQYVIQTSRTNASAGTTYPTYLVGAGVESFELPIVQLVASDRTWPGLDTPYYYNLIETLDYNLSTDGNGNRILTLVDSFEATSWINPSSAAGLGENPSNPIKSDYTLRFSRAPITSGSTRNHSDVIKDLLEQAGYTTDATSFATAASTSLDFSYSIPHFGQDFTTYRGMIERLLQSSFGFLNFNYDTDKFEYYLIDTASSGTTINDDKIILGSRNYSIEYRDIITELRLVNDMESRIDITYENVAPYGTALKYSENRVEISTTPNTDSKYLNGFEQVKVINSLLDGNEFSTNVANLAAYITRLSKFVFKNFRIVEFTLKTNFDLKLFDDITLVSDKNFANQNLNLKIIEKQVKNNEIRLSLTE